MRKTILNEIYQLAKQDKRVVFVGSDLGVGVLDQMKKELPNQFFMEGVSEAAIMGMLAGLAMSGKIPFFNTIGVFATRRCYEQIFLDVAMNNLPVRIIGSGGGFVYAPLGPTHMIIEDISLMRAIPNMTIVAPADSSEMSRFMKTTIQYPGPIYIRLGKGGDPIITPKGPFKIGKAVPLREGTDVCFITTGICGSIVLAAAELLAGKNISAAVIHLPTVKPFDTKTVTSYIAKTSVVITVEEGTIYGGLGSAVAELVAQTIFTKPKRLKIVGLPDEFPLHYGSQKDHLTYYGISPQKLSVTAQRLLKSL
jgi:transketolase